MPLLVVVGVLSGRALLGAILALLVLGVILVIVILGDRKFRRSTSEPD